jgi:hypothetical protein
MATVKDKVFSIRLSQAEYSYLVREAEKRDMSIGAFIRLMTIGDGLNNG